MRNEQILRRICRGFSDGWTSTRMSVNVGHSKNFYNAWLISHEPFLKINDYSPISRAAELKRRADIFLSTGYRVTSYDVKGPPEGKTCTRVKSWDGPRAVLCGVETQHHMCCGCHASLNYPTMRYADAVALVHKMRGVE